MDVIFKAIGALGIILIASGIVIKKRRRQDAFFLAGGVCAEAYSIYIGDAIFIVLEFIFTLAAVYDLYKNRHSKK